MLDRKILFGTTVIAGLAAMSLTVAPSIAAAQTQPAPKPTQGQSPDEQAAAAAAAEDDDAGAVSALVITGSRIKKSEFTSSAPIQVITAEQSTLEGLVDTSEILQQSTLASGSTQINNQLTGFVVDGGPGVNTVSLRGLGANRTLVLLNGRRVGPAGIGGTVGPVDLNTIPSSIIERIEILKDGASSIYGSDAVAGVINIITKQNFDGGELSASGNKAFDGEGGEQYRINGSWGKTFDRGYVNVSADYYHQEALRRKDRDYTSCAEDYLFLGGRGGPRADYADANTGRQYKCYNQLNNGFQVNGFGGTFQYPVPGMVYPNAAQGNNAPIAGPVLVRGARATFGATYPYANYTNEYEQNATVISPVDRYSLFLTGGFDIADNIQAYGELLVNRRESEQNSSRQLFPTIKVLHPSVTAAGFTPGNNTAAGEIPLLFDPDGAGPAPLTDTRLTPIIAIPYTFAQEINYTRGVVGLRGDFGGSGFLSSWSWDVFGQFSHSDGEYSKDIVYADRVYATTQGNTPCDPNPTTEAGVPYGNISNFSCSALPAGGIPWFSPRVLAGDFTDAEKAFLFANETSSTTYDQQLVEASFSGDLFQLPAGSVGAAFGLQYRHEEIDDEPGDTSRTFNIYGLTSSAVTKGDDSVWEAFGEVEVPLFKGIPGIESLGVNLSGRYSNYDSYGSNGTYKIGVNWQVTPAWRIRGTYGTSFRAPGLFEQFLGGQTGFLGQTGIDPCVNYGGPGVRQNVLTNCNQAVTIPGLIGAGLPDDYAAGGTSSGLVQTFGNQDLDAETSKAGTIGVIWTPSFIDLSVAVDYFDIQVDDEVTKFGSGNIVFQCFNSDPADFQAGTNPFCSMFTRQTNPLLPRYQEITNIRDDYTNIAKQRNRGIDLTLRYEHEFDFGRFTFDSQFTWQLEDVSTLLIGASQSDYNGTTNTYDGPDFTGQLSLRFDRGDWTVFWGTDMFGKGSDTENFGGDLFGNGSKYPASNGIGTYYKQYTEFTAYHDLSLRYKMDDWTFQAGILNLFDENPPSQSVGQFRVGTAALNSFDMIGRRGFVTLSKRW
jgi:iron complex outermembrane receptor protein